MICYSVTLRYYIGTTLVFCRALSRVERLVVNYVITLLFIIYKRRVYIST
jgi:hypothetical protein